MCQEEIQEAVCASSLLRDSGLSADCMKVRKCHKGQIISDRQKGQEILGLVVSDPWRSAMRASVIGKCSS